MRFICCGANLFQQWFSEQLIMKEFTEIKDFGQLTNSTLRDINWAYNIFELQGSFYVVGSWLENAVSITKIPLPEESISECNEGSLIIVGNDFNIIIVHRTLNKMWLLDLEDMSKLKEIKLNIEAPNEKSTKKMKKDDFVKKTLASNNTCLILTDYGVVYEGFLPSLVSTSHCKGKVIDIQCGLEHNVLLTDMGCVYTWGNGRRLQLGHGDLTNLEIPTQVQALAGIKITKISAGGWHTLVLSEHGDLYSWGWNDTGQLGIRSDDSMEADNRREVMKGYPIPTVVDLYNEHDEEVPLNVINIACGSRHSAIILEDNTVWTSGNNKYGQLSSPNVMELNYFKKVFQCRPNSSLMCGLWSTILMSP